jgi:hypothetical protein
MYNVIAEQYNKGGDYLKNIKKVCFLLVFAMLFSVAVQQVYAKDYVIGEHKVPVTKPNPASTYVGSESLFENSYHVIKIEY